MNPLNPYEPLQPKAPRDPLDYSVNPPVSNAIPWGAVMLALGALYLLTRSRRGRH